MSRDNNFNLMRILAALAVLCSHSYTIVTGDTQSEPLKQLLGVSLGAISVDMFFASSGFLVCASYFNRHSMVKFIRARVLRIFPALFVMLILTVLSLGLFVSYSSFVTFALDLQTWTYLSKNGFLLFGAEYSLIGVFENNPYPGVVNGSLWSLPQEVRAYLVMVIMCWWGSSFLSAKQIRRLFALSAIALLSGDILSVHFGLEIPHSHFVHVFGVFLLGSTLYLYRFHSHRLLMSITNVGILTFVIAAYGGFFTYVYGWLIPIVSLGLAYMPFKTLHAYNKLGDYSYGMYIYAFPIQQTLVFILPDISVVNMMIYAGLLSLLVAFLSWHFIEKPCLALK